MEKQLKINLDEVNKDGRYEGSILIEEDEDIEDDEDMEDDEESLLYKKRLKKLVKDISERENLKGVQISQEGSDRLQGASKLLISMLVFETLDDLVKDGKKKIMPKHIDKALDKILDKSSAIDIALELLNKDIDKLKGLNNSMAISKATKFINE